MLVVCVAQMRHSGWEINRAKGVVVFAGTVINNLADLSQIVGLAVAVPVIVLAWLQLVSATSAAEAEAVLALDQAFAQFEDLRNELRNATPDRPYRATSLADRASLSRYLVVFDRLGLLVRKGLIDEGRARDLYGYALSRLLTQSNAQEIVSEEMREAREDSAHSENRWENLIKLWKALPHQPSVPEDLI